MFKAEKAMKRYGFLVAIFVAAALLFYVPVLASGGGLSSGHDSPAAAQGESAEGSHGGGGHGSGDRSADLKDLGYRFLNFVLLIIILVWALKKANVKQALNKRIEDIKETLDSLKKEKEASEAKYQELEKKLKDFESEKKSIIEQFVKEGESEKERIIKEARERATQIIEHAGLTIQQEMDSAKDRLKKEVVEIAAQKAQEIIIKEMTDEDQDRLVDEFIERVGNVH